MRTPSTLGVGAPGFTLACLRRPQAPPLPRPPGQQAWWRPQRRCLTGGTRWLMVGPPGRGGGEVMPQATGAMGGAGPAAGEERPAETMQRLLRGAALVQA